MNMAEMFGLITELPDITSTRWKSLRPWVPNPSDGDPKPLVGAARFGDFHKWGVRVGEEIVYRWATLGWPNTFSFLCHYESFCRALLL